MERQKLPHAQSSLILGISSIVTACCCVGLPGLILGVIGLNNAKKALSLFENDPSQYLSDGNAKTGKITSIIGIVIGALVLIRLIYVIATGNLDEQMDLFREAIENAQ